MAGASIAASTAGLAVQMKNSVLIAHAVRLLFISALLTGCGSEVRQESVRRTNFGTKIPVLVYHRIVPDIFWSSVSETSRPDYYRKAGVGTGSDPYLYLRSESDFAKDLSHLAQNGYTPISLYELRQYIVSRDPTILPKKPVVITFDDGTSDWFEIVYPMLAKHNFKATFFLVTSDDIRTQFSTGNSMLTWEQIREMALHKDSFGNALFHFESHTHNHADLSAAAIRAIASSGTQNSQMMALRRELEEPIRILRERLGAEPKFLALPYGAGGQNFLPHIQAFPIIKSLAQELGYLGIRTSRDDIVNDLRTDPYKIGCQLIVFSSTTSDELNQKLSRLNDG